MLDLRSVALIADYFVLCDGHSNRQLGAITNGVVRSLKDLGQHALRVEGAPESGWVLVDFGSVIVHIFSPELRAYYGLEDLWEGAKVVVRMQ